MDEKDLIHYIRRITSPNLSETNIEIGPGDDAASVSVEGSPRIIISTDMLIEGTHFTSDSSPEKTGGKAVGRALSDLAAMAAKPLCSIVAICFPDGRSDEYKCALLRSIQEHAVKFGAPLAGGDTSSGTSNLVITVTVAGVPGPEGIVCRDGALPGDAVCVTGAVGGAGAGRHMSPVPLIEQSLELTQKYDIHAMIDISDGLSTDILHIAEESDVGVTLVARSLPLHPDAVRLAEGEGSGKRGAILHALNDGEDYELLFCLPENQARELISSGISGTAVSLIGTIKETKENSILWMDKTETELMDTGWHHLKNK